MASGLYEHEYCGNIFLLQPLAIAASPHHTSCHICRSALSTVDELGLTARRQKDSLTGQPSTKSGLDPCCNADTSAWVDFAACKGEAAISRDCTAT
jgi:hypothetical protein